MARLKGLRFFLGVVSALPFMATAQDDISDADSLNAFSQSLLDVHHHRIDSQTVRQSTRVGGYARHPDYFREVEVRDEDDRLLSRIRWVRDQPDQAQMIEVFVYDDEGRLDVDYFVAYMVEHRNAPYSALISVHFQGETLKAFRQFDAYGDRVLERCEGSYEGQDVYLNYDDITVPSASAPQTPVYAACFSTLPLTPGAYLRPDIIYGLPANNSEK